MVDDNPQISVVTPSYNYAGFLPAAVESVAQSAVHAEHAIWDGGSTDGTVDYLKAAGTSVRWQSGTDAGQSDALNRAFHMTSAPYVGWLNSDDFYLPGALEFAVDFLERNPGVDILHGDTALVDVNGVVQGVLYGYPAEWSILASRGCIVSSTASFFRRSSLPADPWDPSLKYIMDWDLFLGLLGAGRRFHYVPQLFAAMRIHDGQASHGRTNRSSPEDIYVRRKHGLGVRRSLPGRLLGDVRHKLHKRSSMKLHGCTGGLSGRIQLLSAGGQSVDLEAVEELGRQAYRAGR